MFHEFDKDGSGSVSVDEVKVMLRKLQMPDNEIENLVAIHDKNNDGELQYDEFVSFLLHT
jgi:Ca2+-binding EF-hand superfamily protein